MRSTPRRRFAALVPLGLLVATVLLPSGAVSAAPASSHNDLVSAPNLRTPNGGGQVVSPHALATTSGAYISTLYGDGTGGNYVLPNVSAQINGGSIDIAANDASGGAFGLEFVGPQGTYSTGVFATQDGYQIGNGGSLLVDQCDGSPGMSVVAEIDQLDLTYPSTVKCRSSST